MSASTDNSNTLSLNCPAGGITLTGVTYISKIDLSATCPSNNEAPFFQPKIPTTATSFFLYTFNLISPAQPCQNQDYSSSAIIKADYTCTGASGSFLKSRFIFISYILITKLFLFSVSTLQAVGLSSTLFTIKCPGYKTIQISNSLFQSTTNSATTGCSFDNSAVITTFCGNQQVCYTLVSTYLPSLFPAGSSVSCKNDIWALKVSYTCN